MTTLPGHARAVIVGGGIAGCSTAYHLAKLGWRGLVGQLRASRTMTRMSRYGIDLYRSLEAETGLATGWRQCGSITVARTPERVIQLKRTVATARSFGVEAEFISPAEAGQLWPLM